jgi:hypothetical protein
MVFAVRVIEGAKGQANCPSLQGDKREDLKNYIAVSLRIILAISSDGEAAHYG